MPSARRETYYPSWCYDAPRGSPRTLCSRRPRNWPPGPTLRSPRAWRPRIRPSAPWPRSCGLELTRRRAAPPPRTPPWRPRAPIRPGGLWPRSCGRRGPRRQSPTGRWPRWWCRRGISIPTSPSGERSSCPSGPSPGRPPMGSGPRGGWASITMPSSGSAPFTVSRDVGADRLHLRRRVVLQHPHRRGSVTAAMSLPPASWLTMRTAPPV